MGLKTKVSEKGGNNIIAPEGPTLAICYQVIYLGHQKIVFNGTESYKPKIRFTFELPEYKHTFDEEKGQQPLVVSAEFVQSMNPKSNLYKFIKSWFPKKDLTEGVEVDFTKLINQSGLANIVHNEGKGANAGNKYANIGGIMPLPKGMSTNLESENDTVLYDVDDHDEEVFDSLPEFLQNKILASQEMQNKISNNETVASSNKKNAAKPSATKEVFGSEEEEEEDEAF